MIAIPADGKHTLTAALPVAIYWQTRHQHSRAVIGAAFVLYRTAPQRQPPEIVIHFSSLTPLSSQHGQTTTPQHPLYPSCLKLPTTMSHQHLLRRRFFSCRCRRKRVRRFSAIPPAPSRRLPKVPSPSHTGCRRLLPPRLFARWRCGSPGVKAPDAFRFARYGQLIGSPALTPVSSAPSSP